jgi:LysM repeat protein
MSVSVLRRRGVSAFAWIPTIFMLLQLGGCYTRQIEGIQSDLDDLDRKIHSFNTKTGKSSPSAPSGAVSGFEDDLNQVRMQQAGLRDDLTLLQQRLTEIQEEGQSFGPGPDGGSSIAPAELGQIRKDLSKNKEQTDQLSREMTEVQKTFETLKSETRSLIELLQSEYGTEPAPSGDLISSVPPPSNTQIEAPGETVQAAPSDVTVARTHRVTPGETLISIARKYDVPVENLKEINGIDDPDNLRMGQEIYIP